LQKSWFQLWGDVISSSKTTANRDAPFIGVRPFEYGDREYFFGREDAVDVLDLQVQQNRFVAVVGRRGCGKSSLISAGLRARLEKVSDHRWCWVAVRPGDAPIRKLAHGLAGLKCETGDASEAWADRFERVLTSSSFGIGDALSSIAALQGSDSCKVLLLIDQFEELFRFAGLWSEMNLDLVTATERRDEATKFVRLLLTAMKLPSLPIHIVVSMQSDFIGDCASFHGLPEAVSWSQFLVPGMTRDQREDAIRKPIQLAGAGVDPDLVQRALNDTNQDPDQLPKLQHAMMKCWERACQRGRREVNHRPHLTIDDYTRVGGVASCHLLA
jgi:energy-coupling factor transporter ATP-binding protein EcfA2